MTETIIDKLYSEFQELVSYLDRNSEPSFRSLVDANFRKSLLLAAASYFEDRVTNDLLSFMDRASNHNSLLTEFVRNQGISRKYHTLFKWEARNANQFFGLFGEDFLSFMKTEVKNDENLDAAIKAFLEIGNERNRLVHQNYGTFFLEKTADEIYRLYQTALTFVEIIPDKLKDCPITNQAPASLE